MNGEGTGCGENREESRRAEDAGMLVREEGERERGRDGTRRESGGEQVRKEASI